MRYASRCLVLIAAVLSFSIMLPRLYIIAARQDITPRNYSYSPIINDFVYYTSDRSFNKTYMDNAGNEYDSLEYVRILPFRHVRELVSRGEYNDIINGEFIPAETAEADRDALTIRAISIDAAKTRIQLYPLFESESDFSEIETPPDVFRISSRMEFVNSERNAVDEERSTQYTNALAEAGFIFPARLIAGNPTTRKPYDFGYFVADSAGKLFHIYQVRGRPVVKNTGIHPEDGIYHITVEEDNRPYYGLMISTSGNIYRIEKEGYALNQIPAGNYDPATEDMQYWKDPLNYLIRISGASDTYYAVDKTYNPVKSFEWTPEKRIRGNYRTVYDTIFPFVIRANPYKADFNLQMIPSRSKRCAFSFSLLLAGGYLLFRRGRGSGLITDTALIMLGGIYSLLAIALLDGADKLRNE